jgi:hypothetical protein
MVKLSTLVIAGLLCSVAFGAMPLNYWKNLAHGINSRSLFAPGQLPEWSVSGMLANCSLPTFSVPFDSMSTYGPAGINPVDGTIVMGLKCLKNGYYLPYLWLVNEKDSKVIQVTQQACSSQLREADIFEGYLNFLGDGGLIFGLCGNIYVLPLGSSTLRNLGGYGYSPSILTVVNSKPAQLFVAGGKWDEWWEDWGAIAVNIEGMTSETISLEKAFSVADTTIMFSPDGKTMYNGHFDQWAPGNQYGLQYWKTPFTSNSQPYLVVPECSQSRPWTYSADQEGNVYSSFCDNTLLMKVDARGRQVWNISCPNDNCNYVEKQQMFMTDDERYIYVGSTRTQYYTTGVYYIVDAALGKIIKEINITQTVNSPASCASIYGPFASRWPIPLNKKTRAVFQCLLSTNQTTIYSLDPFTKRLGLKQYPTIDKFVPILLTDSSDNVYALGLDSNGHPYVKRFPA